MEKLQIPTAVQELLDSINATKLNLGEIKIDKHPLVAQDLDRYIQINKISIDLNLPRTYIWYSQVLKDSEGNVVPSNLPTPEWLINEVETSTIRDENFNRILVPVVDEETNEPILNEDGTPINKENYIAIDEAKAINSDLELGDHLSYELEFENMGRNAATILSSNFEYKLQRFVEENIMAIFMT